MIGICAVIPAAGKGSRLGMNCPKILAPIGQRTIWSVLRGLLLPHVDRIHVVLSAVAVPAFEDALSGDPERHRISTSIQAVPNGMGDAVFGARAAWQGFGTLVVIWGDQVNLSARTIRRLVEEPVAARTIRLPLAEQQLPYVQYDMADGRLLRVRQVREGDVTDARGASDVGLFALSTRGLVTEWDNYLSAAAPGANTGEINFLPFLPYLSMDRAWQVESFAVEDPDEARGVNTPADLAFATARLAGCGTPISCSVGLWPAILTSGLPHNP